MTAGRSGPALRRGPRGRPRRCCASLSVRTARLSPTFAASSPVAASGRASAPRRFAARRPRALSPALFAPKPKPGPIWRTPWTPCSSVTRCSRWRWPTRPVWWSPAPSRWTRRSQAARRRALIQASDGAADGAAKREQALRARLGATSEAVARINLFSSSQLDLALGKANVIHAALKSGAATSAFLTRAERLRRFRAARGGRGSQNRRRRRAGRNMRRRLAERTNWLKSQPIRNGHERNEQ